VAVAVTGLGLPRAEGGGEPSPAGPIQTATTATDHPAAPCPSPSDLAGAGSVQTSRLAARQVLMPGSAASPACAGGGARNGGGGAAAGAPQARSAASQGTGPSPAPGPAAPNPTPIRLDGEVAVVCEQPRVGRAAGAAAPHVGSQPPVGEVPVQTQLLAPAKATSTRGQIGRSSSQPLPPSSQHVEEEEGEEEEGGGQGDRDPDEQVGEEGHGDEEVEEEGEEDDEGEERGAARDAAAAGGGGSAAHPKHRFRLGFFKTGVQNPKSACLLLAGRCA
jgi:hypothetical protein